MSLIAVPVNIVQMGLARYHTTNASAVPSPGRIDGVFGPTTRNSLVAFVRIPGNSGAAGVLQDRTIDSIRRITMPSTAPIMLDTAYANLLQSAAQAYRMQGPSEPRVEVDREMPLDQNPAHAQGVPIAVADIPGVVGSGESAGMGTGAKILLGIAVVGIVGAGVYWASK